MSGVARGERLGPYQLLEMIGAGGMGEVWKARDTRLNRIVAIKISNEHFSERFEREARAVSALNHPNICTLYDVGRQDGTGFLVMEYLNGETLAKRLESGPLPIDQTLRIATEVASALDHAHRAGIVHRDLKPSNIMLMKDGAKVLDFGLAKMREQHSEAAVGADSGMQTMTSPLTMEGSLVGTPQYMSPEQLEGKEADARSDIFAFGAVLYELITGRRAFEGKTQAKLIGRIMEHDPGAVSAVIPETPAALERLVRTCLAKDPADRRQTMHDVLLDLRWIAEGGSRPGIGGPGAIADADRFLASRKKTARVWLVPVAVVAMAVGIAYFWLRSRPAAPLMSFVIPAPEKTSFAMGLALSPDGRSVAFAGQTQDGQNALWVRPLYSLSAQMIRGTEGAAFPFWAPDSRQIAFFADGKLKRVVAGGGPVQIVCDAVNGRGGSWGGTGMIVFSPSPDAALHLVPAAGGQPVAASQLDAGRHELSHRWAYFLPDGRHFLFFALTAKRSGDAICVGSIGSKDRQILLRAESSMAYSPPGYLFFVRETTLMAQPFDAGKLRLTGEASPVADGIGIVGPNAPTGYAAFSVSRTGSLVYRTGSVERWQRTWFDRTGRPIGTLAIPEGAEEPRLSQNEKRLAFALPDPKLGTRDLWLSDLAGGTPAHFTFEASDEYGPVWAPDGSRIAFASDRTGVFNLYQKLATGAGEEEVLLESPLEEYPDDWSRDGRTLVFEVVNPKTKTDLWLMPMDGNRQAAPYLQSEFNEAHARLSPDGRWLAYASDESGRAEVYVRPFPVPRGGKWQISSSGGDQPVWRSDGRELFFLDHDRNLMAVEVKAGAAFQAEAPRTLFKTRSPAPSLTGIRDHFVVADNGRKFLVNTPVEAVSTPPIVAMVNWAQGLK